jgi:hypothetical protein
MKRKKVATLSLGLNKFCQFIHYAIRPRKPERKNHPLIPFSPVSAFAG